MPVASTGPGARLMNGARMIVRVWEALCRAIAAGVLLPE